MRFLAHLPRLGLLLLLPVSAAPSCFNSTSAGDANLPGSGRAEFVLEEVSWGRLVDVFDLAGELVERDVLVRDSLQDVSGSYRFSVNPVTQSQVLTIEEPRGSAGFEMLLEAARNGQPAVSTKGLGEQPPYSMVPRNAALRLQFSELVDPATVTAETIRLQIGDPPLQTQPARFVVRNGVLGKDGQPKGVVLLDPVISAYEAAQHGLPTNGIGMPASLDAVAANAVIRIPTKRDPDIGQFQVLRNRGRTHSLQPTDSDPVELTAGQDPVVVRAFRTGNLNDPSRGFLLDRIAPDLVGQFEVSISAIKEAGALTTLSYSIDVAGCRAIRPQEGDVFEVGAGLLLVTAVVDASNPDAYTVNGAVLEDPASFPVGNHQGSPIGARLNTAYRPSAEALQLCWLRITPQPEYGLPGRGIDPWSTVEAVFSEPIDPLTVKSLETFVICSYLEDPPPPSGNDPEQRDRYAARQFQPGQETVGEYIDRQLGYQSTGSGSGRIKFGPIAPSADGRRFVLSPSAGFSDSHDDGDELRFAIALRDGAAGVLDLAGNPVSFSDFVAGNLGQDERIAPGSTSPWPTDRSFALRFNSTDENGDGLSEYGGQYVFEPGLMRGRDLSRFSRRADSSNPFVSQRSQYSTSLMSPLTPAGAVVMSCWPYHTLGLGLLAVAEFNLDVEGMSWAPFGGSVFDDTFEQYSLALSHADRFPDDYISTSTGYPLYQSSGLKRNKDFDENILGFPEHDETVVVSGGIRISSSKVYTAANGVPYHPWGEFLDTYTWRDTAIPEDASLDGPGYRGGDNGNGVPPDTIETSTSNKRWQAGEVPSVGLPLLARFRCYPRANEFGANGFQVQIMTPSNPAGLPAFRVFSAGGFDRSQWHQVMPDERQSGGLHPIGTWHTQTGAQMDGWGPEFYWHEIDFVVKVSRVYTHWFPFGGAPSELSPVTFDPAPELLPPGTEVIVEVRGVASITDDCGGGGPTDDAHSLNLYGDLENSPCASMATPTAWTRDFPSLLDHPSGLDFPYFQLRFTFVSNVDQDLVPELDALGFSWEVEPQ